MKRKKKPEIVKTSQVKSRKPSLPLHSPNKSLARRHRVVLPLVRHSLRQHPPRLLPHPLPQCVHHGQPPLPHHVRLLTPTAVVAAAAARTPAAASSRPDVRPVRHPPRRVQIPVVMTGPGPVPEPHAARLLGKIALAEHARRLAAADELDVAEEALRAGAAARVLQPVEHGDLGVHERLETGAAPLPGDGRVDDAGTQGAVDLLQEGGVVRPVHFGRVLPDELAGRLELFADRSALARCGGDGDDVKVVKELRPDYGHDAQVLDEVPVGEEAARVVVKLAPGGCVASSVIVQPAADEHAQGIVVSQALEAPNEFLDNIED
ncbi:uncharacterized protein E0L32_006592 [Thyridium curvatum]|uniref:Uncharacterized protein n=1 Tax=Thyridium curvatum TaxID=1093900 RepID=A0A507AZJ7_9PEZI|nr:uncharacterized protein E0L32_006592 [Thyridium curvatum]TPX12947.1 hypothetical protein E0L32_006592 [Thyridium curvatum]